MSKQAIAAESGKNTWRFADRWKVEGCLYTVTPLHIGSGEETEHPELTSDTGRVSVSGCFKDQAGRACIPGSAIKGALRALLVDCGDKSVGSAMIEDLFGKGSTRARSGCGGRAEFHDSLLECPRTSATRLPYWRPERQTFITTANCIDRVTGTSVPNKLFYLETVPAGVGFRLVITGSFVDEEQIALLLAALDRINDAENPVTLGGEGANGWGRLRWEAGTIRCMNQSQVRTWIAAPNRSVADRAMAEISGDHWEKLLEKAADFRPPAAASGSAAITLHFTSHFLVNDPPTAREKNVPQADKSPDHRPLLDGSGAPLLPAASLRGALRSRAEKIIRTMGGTCCDTVTPCPGIETKRETDKLCMACRLFGAAGWKSPLTFTDFHRNEKTGMEMPQEFIAIDRFTGGGKDGAKFNAVALYRPVLTGSIAWDQDRMPGWGLGLLGLVLRDLVEGDITFGFGASKGYGTCTAEVDQWQEPGFQKEIRHALDSFRQQIAGTGEETDKELEVRDNGEQ